MRLVPCDVSTLALGLACSAGQFLLSAGTKGKRFALPNSRVMLHQPYGGVQGQITDIEIQANEILRYRQVLNEILSKHSGQALERIEKDTDRDFFLSAEDSKKYGVVDEILQRLPGAEDEKD